MMIGCRPVCKASGSPLQHSEKLIGSQGIGNQRVSSDILKRDQKHVCFVNFNCVPQQQGEHCVLWLIFDKGNKYTFKNL